MAQRNRAAAGAAASETDGCGGRSRSPAFPLAGALPGLASAWEPTKPVEFIVPAGTGGGADQMARLLQGVITKNNLMKQPLIVVNKSGGAGRRRLPRGQGRQGRSAQDHHHAVEPVHHAARHRRAVQLEGPDAGRDAGARPVRAVGQRRDAVQERQGVPRRGEGRRRRASSRWAAPARSRKTRSSPSRIEKATGAKFTYMPFKGGGDVAVQLVGKHIDSSVNNPIEAVAQWRAGKLRPLCVFDDKRMPYKTKVTDTMSWNDIPTLQGVGRADRLRDAARHLHAGRRHQGAGRVLRRPVQEGARDAGVEGVHGGRRVQQTFMAGADYAKWVESAENTAQGADEGSGLPGQEAT